PHPLPSELESSFSRCIGERLDTSVEEVAAAVEDGALDVHLLCVRGQELSDLRRLIALRALERLLELEPARGRDRTPLEVVHELRFDAAVRAEDDEARALGRAADLAAHALVAARASLWLRQDRHRYALLPTFRRTYSPS